MALRSTALPPPVVGAAPQWPLYAPNTGYGSAAGDTAEDGSGSEVTDDHRGDDEGAGVPHLVTAGHTKMGRVSGDAADWRSVGGCT